jgi:ribosomal protein L4
MVVEDFTFETPKTKNFTALLKNFKTEGRDFYSLPAVLI